MAKYKLKRSKKVGNGKLLNDSEKNIEYLSHKMYWLKKENNFLIKKIEENKKMIENIEKEIYYLEQSEEIKSLPPNRGTQPFFIN